MTLREVTVIESTRFYQRALRDRASMVRRVAVARRLWLAIGFLLVNPSAMASPLDDAIPQMRVYCMAEVCLGMTVDQVASMPNDGFQLKRDLNEEKLCTSDPSNNVAAVFTSKAGTKLQLQFRKYPLGKSAREQYRVWAVNLTLKITEGELNTLRRTLTDRYSLVQGADPRMWSRSEPSFTAMVMANFAEGSWSGLSMSIPFTSGALENWLISQPECPKKQAAPVSTLPKI